MPEDYNDDDADDKKGGKNGFNDFFHFFSFCGLVGSAPLLCLYYNITRVACQGVFEIFSSFFWPGSEPSQKLFICKGCLFELDLIRDSVYCEVSAICKGNVILDPRLATFFSYHFLKDFTLIILAFCGCSIKVFLRAEDFRSLRQKENFLFSGGVESQAVSAAVLTRRLVKSENEGKDFRGCFYKVHVLFEAESEHITVSEGQAVVLVNHVIEEVEVSHCRSPFFWSLVSFWLYYTTGKAVCQSLF